MGDTDEQATGAAANSGLRQRMRRSPQQKSQKVLIDDANDAKEEIVWGKTPAGTVFRVPTTYDVLTNLLHPYRAKSHLDVLNLSLLALQLFLFFVLPRKTAQYFFATYFVFWRTAYDGGLGWILTKQSKKRWIVREIQRRGWLDEQKRPKVYAWIRRQLQGKMGKDYSFDSLPIEYNSWLLFRQLVDVILVNDFLSYTLFAFSSFRTPTGLSVLLHLLRWISGIALIAFNIWVKKEAHHVVKDYGWYWGDCFFERGALVFDGVFEMAPHPMYSVGYAGYYGLSLLTGSYPVLFASLAAHIAQFGFLVAFENPHIERMYGKRKLMSLRTPVSAVPEQRSAYVEEQPLTIPNLAPSATPSPDASPSTPRQNGHARTISDASSVGLSTPSATDGETEESEASEVVTETDETETEDEIRPSTPRPALGSLPGSGSGSGLRSNGNRTSNGHSRNGSKASLKNGRNGSANGTNGNGLNSQHDILARFFRHDPIGLFHLDFMRAGDFKLALLVSYIVASALLSQLSPSQALALHFLHALLWRFFHSFGLGLLLREQSRRKYIVRHFMQHYYYPRNDIRGGALEEAFSNWKGLYNMSVCMTYASFFALTWKTYVMPTSWIAGDQLLRHILGASLIALHIWTAVQSFEVLGVFGWFFGDFFIEDYPATLDYTGIYRYLNNPERTMSGAAFFGMALISGSKIVFALAVISHLSHWWFLSNVEDPHMKKVYGPSLRKEAGLTKTIKKLAIKNSKMIQASDRYAPEIRRVLGTVEKVYEEATDVLDDFINKSGPKISSAVQDTRSLIQESRERLVITRLAHDLSPYDVSKYSISLISGRANGGLPLFHLGEPIKVEWHAPKNHSRHDWVGIYRVGANKSTLETRTTSLGMWLGVHDEEWEGNLPVSGDNASASVQEQGTLVFAGDKIPWQVGKYEIRYHHDGKHNVMAMGGPFEIYVSKPATFDFASVRSCLMQIINLCLEADPSLVPASASTSNASATTGPSSPIDDESEEGENPTSDDFRFWSEKQAKRIAMSIHAAFGVEYASSVILADANVSTLTRRILATKELLE